MQLAVTDNGIGMSADDIAQACDSFWRSEVVQRAALPGIGVGLSVVRDIVNAHRGTLEITSELAERGIEVDHVTLYRWVQRFTPLLIEAARRARHLASDRWFVDETYVKVSGVWSYV